jgi:hypothetical protein
MSFFYDLNKKLDGIRATPEVTHQQLNERDMGKHNNATTGFKAVADKAAKEYGSKAAGERVAGAVKAKMAKAGKLEEQDMDESAFQAAIGKKKYGDQGMKALQKAGRDNASAKTMSTIRNKYDKYDEGMMDTVKSMGKKVAGGINKLVGHGSDEDMIKDLQRKSGAPVTGKKPTPPQQVKEKLSPAKQKSFAALAPPTDKITFADKIAGAKKEVDEMLGQVAADAMRSAVGKSSEQRAQQQDDDFVNDHYAKARNNRRVDAEDQWARSKGRNPGAEMDEERSKGTAFDMSTPRAAKPKVGSIERGHKHDIKHTATGRMVTRRVDDQGNSVGADDEKDTQAGPRGRGRPKGTKGSIGAKGPSGKSKLMTREGDNESSELKAAMMLLKKSGYKVTKAESTNTRDDHAERAGKKVTKDIEYDEKDEDGITGKKRGPEDNKAERAGKKVTKDIEHDSKKKKKDEEVDESTTSGSVATSTATKGGGGVYGKGIYDSMNRELENMIAESMSINMSDSTEGGKSLTITATDEDALKLGMMLKNAGLGGGDAHGDDMHSHSEEPCETCGMPDCGCGDVEQAVDENAPDWPTNTETSNNALQYSGGLNKPKADVAGNGQSTVPVVATRPHNEDDDMRRMMEMAGIKQAELEPWEQTMKEDAVTDADAAEDAADETEDSEVQEDFLESIQRMREIAGIKEAKKDVDEEKTEEGNLFTGNLAKARADGKKQADLDGDGDMEKVRESIFTLTNQWRTYKG